MLTLLCVAKWKKYIKHVTQKLQAFFIGVHCSDKQTQAGYRGHADQKAELAVNR